MNLRPSKTFLTLILLFGPSYCSAALASAPSRTTLDAAREELGLAPDVEVTTEANPDSVTPEGLARLREAGFTRISFGMQSQVSHVLAVLDRTHDPLRVPQAVEWARAAGFEQVSLDLIYGTPGESLSDWETSVEAALACGPDHVSAYSLIVEDGTALARRVRRGELPAPDEDDLDLRVAALGQWSEGFLVGFGTGAAGVADTELSPGVQEALSDLSAVSQVTTPEETGEEEERMFEQVAEHCRMSALMIYTDLVMKQQAAKKPGPGDAAEPETPPTRH